MPGRTSGTRSPGGAWLPATHLPTPRSRSGVISDIVAMPSHVFFRRLDANTGTNSLTWSTYNTIEMFTTKLEFTMLYRGFMFELFEFHQESPGPLMP